VIDQRIGKIKVRRGTDLQRLQNTFEEGEVIYSVDKKRIFVGDDITLGGVPVSNRNYIVDSLGFPPVLPDGLLDGDIIFDKSEQKTYITNWNGTEYELLLIIGDVNCCDLLKNQINDLYTKLRTLTGCLTPPTPPTPPPSKLIWVVQPDDNYVGIGDTVTFTASAVGAGSITYVWKRIDGTPINTSNIFKNSIIISDVNTSDIDTYYCIASNEVDSITSRNATLDFDSTSDFILAEDGTYILSELEEFINWEENLVEVTITKQPESVVSDVGNSASFSIEVTGTPPITYQWRIAGVDISGETNSTYTISNVTTPINSITCKISNPAGDILSNSVNLVLMSI
jgi:hypothetical protein